MQRSCSLFQQIANYIPRSEFDQHVIRTLSERHARGVSSWDHFMAMLFCHLQGTQSLREIEGGLRCCEGKLKHLGVEPVSKSSLSYANIHRPAVLFSRMFEVLQVMVRSELGLRAPKKKFRFKNPIASLDSTVFDLCVKMFDWNEYSRAKGAVKLHMVLDHESYLPAFAVLTDGKVADVTVAKDLRFQPGTVLAIDRGYIDYEMFARWTEQRVHFVTRLKGNAAYEVVEQRAVTGNVRKDELIQWTRESSRELCPYLLRRVEVHVPEEDRILIFLTNHTGFAASTIASIYKERWQIELFFKAIKQNLRIKSFIGTTENAVKIQIWSALIAMLLLRFLQLRSTWGWSLSNLAAMLRMNLLTYRPLWGWLNKPYGTPQQRRRDEPRQWPLLLAFGQHQGVCTVIS